MLNSDLLLRYLFLKQILFMWTLVTFFFIKSKLDPPENFYLRSGNLSRVLIHTYKSFSGLLQFPNDSVHKRYIRINHYKTNFLTVTVIFLISENSVFITHEFWKQRGFLVRIRYMHKEFFCVFEIWFHYKICNYTFHQKWFCSLGLFSYIIL